MTQVVCLQYNLGDRTFSGLSTIPADAPEGRNGPLVVALHGGTYTSRYFDIAGHSMMAQANALNLQFVALDRPGYGTTPLFAPDEASQVQNAAILSAAIGDLWRQNDERCLRCQETTPCPIRRRVPPLAEPDDTAALRSGFEQSADSSADPLHRGAATDLRPLRFGRRRP